MNNILLTLKLGALTLLACLGLCSCNQSAQAQDDHAGHDHAAEAVQDDHAGHDHDAAESHDGHDEAMEDEHAGHGHGNEAAGDDEADPHVGHGAEDGGEEGTITLDTTQIRELGISSAPAGPGELGRMLELAGEVAVNEDEVTHVSPRVGGIIRTVFMNLGDHVQAGTALVELDSIELAEANTEYLATLSRLELAEGNMHREQMLLDKGISAEQEYLAARQQLDELHITRRSLEQKLAALGLSQAQISGLAEDPNSVLTTYTVTAPVAGEVTEKHASLGEVVGTDTELFTISDLSSVWVRLNVYQQDFRDVREGMQAIIDLGSGEGRIDGTIDYIEPIIGEETRTAIARVVIPRSSHVLRPGLFVTGYVEVGGEEAALAVPRDAVVDLDEDKLVFIRDGLTFIPQVVTTGRETAVSIEITSGLEPGTEIAVSGTFQLKAELLKGTFDPHAGHAH